MLVEPGFEPATSAVRQTGALPTELTRWLFVGLYSGFQSLGFRIPLKNKFKFSGHRNPDSLTWGEDIVKKAMKYKITIHTSYGDD